MQIIMCPKCSIKMKFDESINGYVCIKCGRMTFIPAEPKKK